MKKTPELFIFGLDGANTGYIKSEIARGNLPNFKRAVDNGCILNDLQPPFPSISSTGWVTLATGATPDVHGTTCELFHVPGLGDPDELVSGYSGKNNHAEKLWEAASRAGKKSLVIDYCVTAECKSDNVRVIYNNPAQTGYDWTKPVYKRQQPSYTEIPAQFYAFDADYDYLLTSPAEYAAAASGKWQPQIKMTAGAFVKMSENMYRLEVKYSSPLDNPHGVPVFYWYMRKTDSGAEFAFERNGFDKNEYYSVALGRWSDDIRRTLESDTGEGIYTFRIKLISGEREGSFAVFITGSVDYAHISYPESFAERLSELVLPPLPNSYAQFFPSEGSLDISFECLKQKCDYYKILLADACENDPADVIFTCLGYTDSINHMYQGVMSGAVKAGEAQIATAREAYRRGYEMADELLGWIYENVISDDTLLCIISDHGGLGVKKQLFPYDFFGDAGMFSWENTEKNLKTPWRQRKIDWSKTTAYPVSSSSVFVNLKGRDPHGIVEPQDYDKTVQRIIDVLRKSLRTDTGESYLAFAVPNKQARFMHLNLPQCGDVVYGLTGSENGGYIGGVHACQVPGAATSEFSSIRCLGILSGRGIKKKGEVNRPANLCDIAPTLCFSSGYPVPENSNGAVLFDLLDGNNTKV